MQEFPGWITDHAGVISTDITVVLDYLIVPVVWDGEAKQEYKQLVNTHWLVDCIDAGELLPVAVHHVPLLTRDKRAGSPLTGVVAGVSGYEGRERVFINSLVEFLGGTAQVVSSKHEDNLMLSSTPGNVYQERETS